MLLKYVWFGQGIFITITREHFVINAFKNSGNSNLEGVLCIETYWILNSLLLVYVHLVP